MLSMRWTILGAVVSGIVACAWQHMAEAQSWPNRPIRLIVGFAPGGPNDIVARLVGQKLSESLGVQVYVDPRPGADSIIGTDHAAKSAPDGYTILMISGSSTIHPSVYTKLPYDLLTDFEPLTILTTSSYVLVVNPSKLPAKSLSEFVAAAKKKGDTLNYAGAGVGDTIHLAGEMLKSMAGFQMTMIPYHGGGPAIAAVLSGQTELMISAIATAVPHIQSGALTAIAVTGLHRTATMPTVPTFAEAGMPGYEVTGWYGLVAPKGTPQPVMQRLNADTVKVLAQKDTKQRLSTLGMEPVGTSTEATATYLRAEVERWAKIAKAAKIPPKSL